MESTGKFVDAPTRPPGGHVLLYDGECGMCQATVRWMLRHDRRSALLFAPQQWTVAEAVLERHGLSHERLNSAVLVVDFGRPSESLALHSDAILGSLEAIGGFWAFVARAGRLVPRGLRNMVYRWVARNRIRIFGTAEVCALPTPRERSRFLGT